MSHTENTTNRDNAVIKILIVFLLGSACLLGLYACKPSEPEAVKQETSYISEATGPYATGTHHAVIHVKDFGDIKVELNATVAPVTVSTCKQRFLQRPYLPSHHQWIYDPGWRSEW